MMHFEQFYNDNFGKEYKKYLRLTKKDKETYKLVAENSQKYCTDALLQLCNYHDIFPLCEIILQDFYDTYRSLLFLMYTKYPENSWDDIEVCTQMIIYGFLLEPLVVQLEKDNSKTILQEIYDNYSKVEHKRDELVKILAGYAKYWHTDENDIEADETIKWSDLCI